MAIADKLFHPLSQIVVKITKKTYRYSGEVYFKVL